MIIIIHRRFWRQTHTSFIWFVFYNNKFEITTSTSSFFLTKITILKKKDGNSSKLTFDYRFWIRLWRFVFKIFVWSWILIKFWKSYISLNILKSCDPSFWTDFTSTLKILLVFYIFPNTTLIFFLKRFKFLTSKSMVIENSCFFSSVRNLAIHKISGPFISIIDRLYYKSVFFWILDT